MTSSLEVLRSHAIYINPSFSEKPIKIPSQMYPLTDEISAASPLRKGWVRRVHQ